MPNFERLEREINAYLKSYDESQLKTEARIKAISILQLLAKRLGPTRYLDLENAFKGCINKSTQRGEFVFTFISTVILDIHSKGDKGWGDLFIKLKSIEIASLFSQLWPTITEKTTAKFLHLAEFLTDVFLLDIPENPSFCKKSDDGWRILDTETISTAIGKLRDAQQIMEEIESKELLGIGYQLSKLSDETRVLNKVLIAWYQAFPTAQFELAPEAQRRDIIANHELILYNADRLLDNSVWDALPEEIKSIQKYKDRLARLAEIKELVALRDETLEAQQKSNKELKDEKDPERCAIITADLAQYEETLDWLDSELVDDESIEGLTAEEEIIKAQLLHAETLKPLMDIDRLKLDALGWVEYYLSEEECDVSTAALLNYDESDERCTLTYEEISNLSDQVVDRLVARNYKTLTDTQPGILEIHLQNCRDKQSEEYSWIEDSLRTLPDDEQNYHRLKESEFRDPIDGRAWIDSNDCSDAEDFRDIVIGGCLWAAKENPQLELPENIQRFLASFTDLNYQSIATWKFIQFKANNLQLPPEQYEILRFIQQEMPVGLASVSGLFAPNTSSDTSSTVYNLPPVCHPPTSC